MWGVDPDIPTQNLSNLKELLINMSPDMSADASADVVGNINNR